MTRDEAISAVRWVRTNPEVHGLGMFLVDSLAALGLLKLEEPGLDGGPAASVLRNTSVALVGYTDSNGHDIQYAGNLSEKSIQAVLNALNRAGLKIVEKDKA